MPTLSHHSASFSHSAYILDYNSDVVFYARADHLWKLYFCNIAYDSWRLLHLDSFIFSSYHKSRIFDLVVFTTQFCDDQEYEDVSRARERGKYDNRTYTILHSSLLKRVQQCTVAVHTLLPYLALPSEFVFRLSLQSSCTRTLHPRDFTSDLYAITQSF